MIIDYRLSCWFVVRIRVWFQYVYINIFFSHRERESEHPITLACPYGDQHRER